MCVNEFTRRTAGLYTFVCLFMFVHLFKIVCVFVCVEVRERERERERERQTDRVVCWEYGSMKEKLCICLCVKV